MSQRKLFFALIIVAACGLIAAGCGDDDETTTVEEPAGVEDIQAPESAQDAIDQAQEQLDDLPGNVDEAVQQCIDQAESSELPDDQVEDLKQLCESAGDAAENAPGGEGG